MVYGECKVDNTSLSTTFNLQYEFLDYWICKCFKNNFFIKCNKKDINMKYNYLYVFTGNFLLHIRNFML